MKLMHSISRLLLVLAVLPATTWGGASVGLTVRQAGTDFVKTQFMHVIESASTDPLGPCAHKGKLVERNAQDGSVLQLNGKRYAIYSVWNETRDLAIRELSNPWTTVGEETTLARPELPWERQEGTVLEGPVALQRDGTEDWIAYHANDQATDVRDMGRTPRMQSFT